MTGDAPESVGFTDSDQANKRGKQMTPENEVAATPRATAATVARKLYLTALGLAAAWAIGTLLFFATLARDSIGPDNGFVGLVFGMALAPLLVIVALNRWWRWLRRP